MFTDEVFDYDEFLGMQVMDEKEVDRVQRISHKNTLQALKFNAIKKMNVPNKIIIN